jgi:hypothetical protein
MMMAGGDNAGHVRVFEYDSSVWSQLGADIDGVDENDQLGYAVSFSVDGTRLAIGVRHSDASGGLFEGGHVVVMEYDSTAWVQVGADIEGLTTGEESGFTISLSANGTRVAIGAPWAGLGWEGHARVFEYVSSTWMQLGSDITGENAGDSNGWGVSLSADGSRVAVGAKQNAGAGADAGHVRVYEYVSSAWVQLGGDIDGEAGGDESGWSVSLSADGTRLAIGAHLNDGGASDAGHVRVFEYDFLASAWVQMGADMDGTVASGHSGRAVALSSDGNRVAIGAYNAGSAGQVEVWQLAYLPSGVPTGAPTQPTSQPTGTPTQPSGQPSCQPSISIYPSGEPTSQPSGQPTFGLRGWHQVGADIDGEAAGDESGTSVSLSLDGDVVAIGAYNNDGTGSNAGHVRVYEYDSSSWVQLGADIDGEAAGDGSGFAVSLSSDGSRVAIGAYLNDGVTTNAGHVRVFEYDSSTWIQLGSDIDGEDGNDFSGYALSLSLDGSHVAIGAKYNNNGGHDAGNVRVFKYDSSSWVQVGSSLSGEDIGDQFGFSVSLSSDGSQVAIGAPLNDGSGSNAGHTQVFEYDSSTWVQLGGDIDGEGGSDSSGWSVSLSSDGGRVAIGAPLNDIGGIFNAGHVRVYEYDSSTWVQLGADIDGESTDDQIGWSVCLSSDGSRVAVGSKDTNGAGVGAGHVRIYDYDFLSRSWAQIGTDIVEYDSRVSGSAVSLSPDGSCLAIGSRNVTDNAGRVRVWQLDYFPSGQPTGQPTFGLRDWNQVGADIDGDAAGDENGFSVSLSSDGSRVAVGVRNDAGYVRVFAYDSTSWVQLGADIEGEAAGDQSGQAVSLSSHGTRVAIGARYNDNPSGSSVGHVRVYEYDSSTWQQLGGDIDGEAANDNSGYAVSLSATGSVVAVGSRYNDGTASDAGHVRVFKYQSSSWVQLGADIDGEAAGDHNGFSLSLSSDGNRVAMGAPYHDGIGADAGRVRVFEYVFSAWVQLGGNVDGEGANDVSGWSVALSSSGDRVAVGAYLNDDSFSNAGHVRVYEYESTSWVQLGDDIDGQSVSDGSGSAVSISSDGSRVAIGAKGNTDYGINAGHVSIYDYDFLSGSWIQMGADINGDVADG